MPIPIWIEVQSRIPSNLKVLNIVVHIGNRNLDKNLRVNCKPDELKWFISFQHSFFFSQKNTLIKLPFFITRK